MLGIVNNSIAELIVLKFGEHVLKEALKKCSIKIAEDSESYFYGLGIYDDALTYQILETVSQITKVEISDLLLQFGEHWLQNTICKQVPKLLTYFGDNFLDILMNLEAVHTNLLMLIPGIRPPSFWMTNITNNSFHLHYKSGNPKGRPGLAPIVMGALYYLASKYNLKITVEHIEKRSAGYEHDVFKVVGNFFIPNENMEIRKTDNEIAQVEMLNSLFPYHVLFDSQFRIVNVGSAWKKYPKVKIGSCVNDHLTLWRPSLVEWDFQLFIQLSNRNNFIFEYLTDNFELKLMGQLLYIINNHDKEKLGYMAFLGSPMIPYGDTSHSLKDFALHQTGRIDLFRNHTQNTPFSEIKQLEQSLHNLRLANEEIKRLKEQSERVLLNVLPKLVVDKLYNSKDEDIAELYPDASILFADIVGFTKMSAHMNPRKLIKILNKIFTKFDSLGEQRECPVEKVKTIGDAYMVVSGALNNDSEHAVHLIEMGFDMLNAMKEISKELNIDLSIRIGINSGPVIGGVVGKRKYAWDFWGDSVNIASRMESTGIPGHIQISEATYQRVKNVYVCKKRAGVRIKGRGVMTTYIVVGKIFNRSKSASPSRKNGSLVSRRKSPSMPSLAQLDIERPASILSKMLTPHHTRWLTQMPNKKFLPRYHQGPAKTRTNKI